MATAVAVTPIEFPERRDYLERFQVLDALLIVLKEIAGLDETLREQLAAPFGAFLEDDLSISKPGKEQDAKDAEDDFELAARLWPDEQLEDSADYAAATARSHLLAGQLLNLIADSTDTLRSRSAAMLDSATQAALDAQRKLDAQKATVGDVLEAVAQRYH